MSVYSKTAAVHNKLLSQSELSICWHSIMAI